MISVNQTAYAKLLFLSSVSTLEIQSGGHLNVQVSATVEGAVYLMDNALFSVPSSDASIGNGYSSHSMTFTGKLISLSAWFIYGGTLQSAGQLFITVRF